MRLHFIRVEEYDPVKVEDEKIQVLTTTHLQNGNDTSVTSERTRNEFLLLLIIVAIIALNY